MNSLNLILFGLILFLLSFTLVRAFCGYALKKGLLDTPNARSSHQIPTPRGGGIVFVLLWFLILGLAFWLDWLSLRGLFIFLPTTLCVSFLGYWDDNQSLSAKKRLIIQAIAASFCVFLLGDITTFHLFSNQAVYLGWAGGITVATLGLIWSTNLFNFMDGLDGLAAVEALFVLGIGGGLYWFFGPSEMAYILWALVLTVAGFLVLNWPKARVFMGDVGSYCLGFLIALFAIIGECWYKIPIVLWVILYGVFWFDATMTLLRRFLTGETLTTAHREHAYQRLHRAGFSHAQVLLCVIGLNICLASIVIIIIMASHTPEQLEHLGLGFLFSIGILTAAYSWVEKLQPFRHLEKELGKELERNNK